jgi:nitrogen fixation NifU-like protein
MTEENRHPLSSPEKEAHVYLVPARTPEHLGHLAEPDGYAYLRGDCGDALEVFLSVRDRRIMEARFDALGCEFTLACGNAAMELAEGQPLDVAMGMDPQRISERLGGLPPSHEHCAELAVETLGKAVRDVLLRLRDPDPSLQGVGSGGTPGSDEDF